MADQNLKITVAAETAAAQKAIDDLSASELGLAKASDRAGDAVKRTAQEVAEATAKQNAAREAAQRAAKALAEHTAITQAFGKDSAEAAASLARLKAAQAAAETAAREAERALEGAAKAVAETARNADEKATPALRRMKGQLEAAGKSAESTASDLRALEARIESVGGAAKGMGAAMSAFVGNLAANAVSSLAGRLGDLGMHAVTTAASFESMKTALASTLGSQEEANKKFAELQQFAAATPFALEETTQGFLKLKNLGLDASTRAMTAYGDMAGATGKTMMDVVEAVADAAQGEGERLKELGIRMSKDGDKVRLTFRGMTQEMKFDSKEIEQYLIRLGETNFGGGMAAQSKTLGGMISTLKDGFDQFIVTVMDSGITQALKSLIDTFTGMGETGKFLSDLLGLTLGGAFTALSMTAKVAAEAIELFFTAVNFLVSPVYMAKDAIESLARDSMTSIVAETEKLIEAQKELDRQYWESAKGTGTLASDMQGLIDLSGKYALSIAAEGLAHLEAANAADRRMKSEADLWAKMEARNAKAEDKAIEDAFMAANEMGPALPPGFKREKKKGKKKADLSGQGMEAAKRYEAETRREREQAFAAEVAAFERESALRDQKIAGIGREIEALDARGVAEAEQVDMIFATVEVESEAARQREALIDQRLDAEERLARWQVKNAKTAADRERAQTRLEQAEHAKRLRAAEKAADDEAKTARQREQVFGTLARAHNTLAETMVDAAFKAAEGEKVAIAAQLQELLKGVARKHAILALGEAALAIGAAASYRYAAAAQHGAAAALHTGVAIAAGVGAFAAGKIAPGGPSEESKWQEEQDRKERKDAWKDANGYGGGARGGGSSGGAGGGRGRGSDQGDVEAQEVPVSHEQLRRNDGRLSRGEGGGVVVNIIKPTIAGAGGVKHLAREIQAELERYQRSGYRPRN